MREWIHRAQLCVLTILILAATSAAEDDDAQRENAGSAVWDAAAPRELRADRLNSWHGGSAIDVTADSETPPPFAADEILQTSFEETPSPSAPLAVPELAPTVAVDLSEAEPLTGTAVQSAETPPAAEAPNGDAIPEWKGQQYPAPLDLGDLVGRLVVGTGIVLGLAVIAVLVIRKWMGPMANLKPTPSRRLQHVESLALPNRNSLQLVELDGRAILVGMNAAGLQTIVPLEKSFAEQLAAADEPNEMDAVEVEADSDERPAVMLDVEREHSGWTEKAAAFLAAKINPQT